MPNCFPEAAIILCFHQQCTRVLGSPQNCWCTSHLSKQDAYIKLNVLEIEHLMQTPKGMKSLIKCSDDYCSNKSWIFKNGVVIAMQLFISLKCTIWFDVCVHCRMITTISLV